MSEAITKSRDMENTGTELDDLGSGLIPAEGDLVNNSSGATVEVEDLGTKSDVGGSSGNLLAHDTIQDEADESPEGHPTQQMTVNSTPAISGLTTLRMQEITNELIDSMVDKLKGLRTDLVRSDLEANVDGRNDIATMPQAEIQSSPHNKRYDTWPPKNMRSPDTCAVERSRFQGLMLDTQLDSIPDMWSYWPDDTSDSSTRRLLIGELALALKPYSGAPLFTATSVTIIKSIGTILECDARMPKPQLLKNSHEEHLENLDLEMLWLAARHPDIVTKVVIEAVNLFNRNMTLGSLLEKCFEKGDEFRPLMFSTFSPTFNDILILFLSLRIATLGNFRLFEWTGAFNFFVNKSKQSDIAFASPVAYLLSLAFEDIETYLLTNYSRSNQPWSDGVPKKEKLFSSDDLDVHSLISIKGFQVSWTFDPQLHLSFDSCYQWLSRPKLCRPVLYVYWFPPFEKTYLSRTMPVGLMPWELTKTMELLFGGRGSFNSSQSRKIRRTYFEMPIPDQLENVIPWPERDRKARRKWLPTKLSAIIPASWLESKGFPRPLRAYILQMRKKTNMKDFLKVFPREDHEALGLHHNNKLAELSEHIRFPTPTRLIWAYSEFPYYGKRLRELRFHMDKTKPRGVRGLLKDKRDSLGQLNLPPLT
ncbi:hypothetical protein BDZ45DRAFT_449001 [Acephala macrosclerotiorum]|nr:hypothetical protein BDZ45DRAFT_449001 [Acephala macrosclerotiorum]